MWKVILSVMLLSAETCVPTIIPQPRGAVLSGGVKSVQILITLLSHQYRHTEHLQYLLYFYLYPFVSDLEYISCDICIATILEGIRQTELMRIKAKGKLKELQVSDMMDNICDPQTEEGSWLNSLDFYSSSTGSMVEDNHDGSVVGSWQRGFKDMVSTGNDYLLIFQHKYQGLCEEECLTAALSCERLMDEINVDMLAVCSLY